MTSLKKTIQSVLWSENKCESCYYVVQDTLRSNATLIPRWALGVRPFLCKRAICKKCGGRLRPGPCAEPGASVRGLGTMTRHDRGVPRHAAPHWPEGSHRQ